MHTTHRSPPPLRSFVLAASTLAVVGCIEPTNPCDPAADPALQAEGTRISGVVKDTDGHPLAGVVVAVTGRADTAVSADGGGFSLTNLPPASSYELVALPQAPAVGGRVRTGPLVCQGAIEDVEVLVVVPPPSPEVELVRASGDKRLLVAFAGVEPVPEMGLDGGGLYGESNTKSGTAVVDPSAVMDDVAAGMTEARVTFRVQVRTPFGAWRDAVLTPYPWSKDIDAAAINTPAPVAGEDDDAGLVDRGVQERIADTGMFTTRVDDAAAAALCSQFAYLDDALRNPDARCAEVVGLIVDETVEGLEPHASYHVRVVAEAVTPPDLRASALLPERVEGAPASRTGQMSLVPSAVREVATSDGSLMAARGLHVMGVVPTAGGRFAVLSTEEVTVIGDGADTMEAAARDAFTGGYQALCRDDYASETATTDLYGDGTAEAVSLLPAGQWMRVVGKMANGASQVSKVYLGDSAEGARDGATLDQLRNNEVEPEMAFDVSGTPLGRPISWGYLMRDASPLTARGALPADAYLFVYPHALVLSEQRVVTQAGPASLAMDKSMELAFSGWAAPVDDNPTSPDDDFAALGGDCPVLGLFGPFEDAPRLDGIDGLIETRRGTLCLDLREGLRDDVELVDHEVLPVSDDPLDTFHLLADAANDRVFALPTRRFLCSGCVSVSDSFAKRMLDSAVAVGREPTGMMRSAVIDACTKTGEPEQVITARTSVVLVANRRGGDVSVLGVNSQGAVEELYIVPTPANVVGFVEDAGGPDCLDPFAWAVAEDGRLFPIDMRGAPSLPLCDGRACEVSTRGRATTGAIGRRSEGARANRARAIVGGPGLLGEISYHAPRAPPGMAYEEPVAQGTGARGP